MSWNKTIPLPRPAPAAGETEASPSSSDTSPEVIPSGAPPISATPASSVPSNASGSLPASIALSSGEFSESPFDVPSSWGGVPPQVLAPPAPQPVYPPLPRPYYPTQTSAQMHGAPTASPVSDTLEMKGPPSGLPTLVGGAALGFSGLPTGLPGPPVSSTPGEAAPPATRHQRAPQRTAMLLGQTASVEAPEATPSQAVREASLERPGIAPLPPDAPPWMVTARYLSNMLEAAIASGGSDPALQAAAQRALWAFRLSGHPPAQIARVHHLVERAFDALRSTRRADLDGVLRDCSLVIWRSLPGQVRAQLSDAQVEAIVRSLHAEPDHRRARGLAVARLLGWPPLPEAWLLDAVDSALKSSP